VNITTDAAKQTQILFGLKNINNNFRKFLENKFENIFRGERKPPSLWERRTTSRTFL